MTRLNAKMGLALTGTLTLLSPIVRAQLWTQSAAPTNSWAALAASADATKLFAAADDSYNGNGALYSSSDSGRTWTITAAPQTNWTCIACSADGTKVSAAFYGAGWGSGLVYFSTDSGA